jgi:GNAT superfamily N-acetyltransferase
MLPGNPNRRAETKAPEHPPNVDGSIDTSPPSAVRLTVARDPPDLDLARTLFREYADTLGFGLDFQGFDEELAALPGEYAEPRGTIVLAHVGEAVAGCVALRPLPDDPDACEMKRMYVRPLFQGKGLGRKLGERILADARARGYRVMRLDTIDTMTAAIALYRDLGFRTIPAYRYNPVPGALYFEADL